MILINPPPDDNRCESCGKHTSDLEPFDESPRPVDRWVNRGCVSLFITEDRKLAKIFRSDDGEVVYASWECKICFCKPDEPVHQNTAHNNTSAPNYVQIKASIYGDDHEIVTN